MQFARRAPDILHHLLGRAFVAKGFFIIFNSNWGKDELQTLRYTITLNCPMGADVRRPIC